jgi:hypothetical protein
MAELVTIPVSFFEVSNEYEWPNLLPWVDRAPIVQVILDGLRAWDPHVDNVEVLTAGKLSEQGFVIRLPLKRVALFFGPANCRFSRDAVDWSVADETMAIFEAALTAFIKLSNVAIARRKTAIGLHIQPKTTPFIKLLQPFMPEQLAALETGPLRTMAVVAKWDQRTVTLDGSFSLANGLFLKFEREFPGTSTDGQIAEQLLKDEEQLLALLGVKEGQ